MADRLFVSVLGRRNAGKSTTWNSLFGSTVQTGRYSRILNLCEGECVEVFLISGSPEERDLYAGDILAKQTFKIILCSIQYIDTARRTLEYVSKGQFDFYVQWLNPGHNDSGEYLDRL